MFCLTKRRMEPQERMLEEAQGGGVRKLRLICAPTGNFFAKSYASETSSFCSVRSLAMLALGATIIEKGSPMEEKVLSSTPVILAPRVQGKVEDTCCTLRSWSTTDCAGWVAYG